MSVTSLTSPGRGDRAQPYIDLRGESTSPHKLARELWRARELLLILARKEFHVQYRRASFGVGWAVALPLLQAVVMAVVFSRVAHIRTIAHTSYTMFVLSGMAPWTFFMTALSAGSTAAVDNAALASKVYFPRVVLPLVQVGTALYGFVITEAIVFALCPLLHVSLGLSVLLVIPGTVLLVLLACGFALLDSVLHVYFRDMRYLVGAALMVWMYVTPIVYPPFDAPHTLRKIIDFNPVTGAVDLFRAATVGHVGPMAFAIVISVAWTVALLVIGFALQCRFNRVMADLL